MITTIEVVRDGNESNSSLLRRFQKRVQGSGIIRQVKSLKAASRTESHYKKKKSALKRLERSAAYERLKKLGKN
jgi:ribosomal protein S21